jgi:hypothetical protein
MFSRWLTLSNAVREGARTAVVFRGPTCNAGQVETDVKTVVTSYANAGGVPISAGDVTVAGQCGASVPFASSLGTINLDYTSTMRNE